MSIVVIFIGALVILIGILGAASPDRLILLIGRWQGPSRLWTTVLIRLVLGVALILAAPSCRLPVVVSAIGILALISAVVIPILGQRRFDSFIDWCSRRRAVVVRSWSLAAVVFGGVLIYAAG